MLLISVDFSRVESENKLQKYVDPKASQKTKHPLKHTCAEAEHKLVVARNRGCSESGFGVEGVALQGVEEIEQRSRTIAWALVFGQHRHMIHAHE